MPARSQSSGRTRTVPAAVSTSTLDAKNSPWTNPGGQCGDLLDNGFVPRSQPVEADAARSMIQRAVHDVRPRPLDPQAVVRAVVPHEGNGGGCARQQQARARRGSASAPAIR